METPRCSEISNLSADWKLNPNVECRIILNKLNIKTPEYETMEFCRTLTNTTKDMGFDFKSEFILDVLLNDILRKCDDNCELCEEYVQQLRHHITQAHTVNPNAQTVFKCDVCSSIHSSPSMLIRHRNTHSNSDTLTTPCTNDGLEPEPVRFRSNNIDASFDISSVSRRNESVSSVKCEDHSHQPVPVPPMNYELNFVKQESSQSQLEMSNPNPLGILEHVNHLSSIENNLKQEYDDSECQEDLTDPLLLQDLHLQQVPSFVESECTMISTKFEQQTILAIQDMSSNETNTGRESFPIPSDSIRHKIAHTAQKPLPHKCNICGKCFDNLYQLTQHKIVHSRKKPHKCDLCEKSFKQSAHLTRHKLTHTTGETPFHCDVCGRYFGRRAILTRHKLVHTGERAHTCDVCGQDFNQRSHLTHHKLEHTGERPHTCDVCGKSLGRRFDLTRHKLTHTSREKPFHCDVCGQSFYQGYELNKHKLKHTRQSTITTTFVNHLKEERESEEEGCQEDPLLNLELSS